MPPVPFTTEQAARSAALAFVALVANFCGGLLTQNGDAVTDTFHQTDSGAGLRARDRAHRRAGVAGGDRAGRPSRAPQADPLLPCRRVRRELRRGRGAVVRGLHRRAALHPGVREHGASSSPASLRSKRPPRALARSPPAMFALALGVGIALGVIFLPFADLGNYGWRISFIVSAAALFFLPFVGRQLRETRRYDTLVGQSVDHAVDCVRCSTSSYRARFLLLGVVAFITNVFIAPSSQLTNRYLTQAHDFTNSDVAGFRTVTAGLPGVIGVLLAGRLAESRGRRPVDHRRPAGRHRVPGRVLRGRQRRAAVDRADDRHRRRRVRRTRPRHARRRAVPHRGARHVERLPPRRRRRRLGGWTRGRDPTPAT